MRNGGFIGGILGLFLIGLLLGLADCSSGNLSQGGSDSTDSGSKQDPQDPSDPGPRSNPGPGSFSDPTVGVTDAQLILNPAPLPLPAVAATMMDPGFGVTFYRVSDSSARGGFETQIYSQLQAFSSDHQYLLLDGSEGFIVRRIADFSQVGGLDTSSWNAPRWHPQIPHTLLYFDSNEDETVRLQFTDVDSLQTATAYTFPSQYQRIRVNQSFDEVSDDGRWLGGMLSRSDGASVIFSLDLQNGSLGALLPLPDLYQGPCQPDPQWGEVEPDWVGVSPLGRYLLVQWTRDGTARCSGLESFDIRTGEFKGRVYDGHQHGDLGVMPGGAEEFFMTFELYHPDGRLWLGLRFLPGENSVGPPEYLQPLEWGNGEHISCRGPAGVCLVTAGVDAGNGWNPFEGELFLQYTDGRVRRLIHHRSSQCGYWVQPRATFSRDGHYIAFASDWGLETGRNSCQSGEELGRGDPYLIDLFP